MWRKKDPFNNKPSDASTTSPPTTDLQSLPNKPADQPHATEIDPIVSSNVNYDDLFQEDWGTYRLVHLDIYSKILIKNDPNQKITSRYSGSLSTEASLTNPTVISQWLGKNLIAAPDNSMTAEGKVPLNISATSGEATKYLVLRGTAYGKNTVNTTDEIKAFSSDFQGTFESFLKNRPGNYSLTKITKGFKYYNVTEVIVPDDRNPNIKHTIYFVQLATYELVIPSINNKLINAIERGNIDLVKQAVSEGADVHKVDPTYSKTPLHLAAEKGFLDIVEYLISLKVNINAVTPTTNYTPLHLAVMNGKSQVVSKLITLKADQTIYDNKNKTPLHIAATLGNLSIITSLVNGGGNLNKSILGEDTPFYLAIENGFNITDFIIRNFPTKIDVNVVTSDKTNALHKLYDRDSYYNDTSFKKVFDFILPKTTSIDLINENGKTILYRESEYYANLEILTELLEKGANPNLYYSTGSYKFYPIHEITDYSGINPESSLLSALDLMIQKSADVKVENHKLLVNLTCHRNSLTAVKKVVASGANLLTIYTDGNNLLHYVANCLNSNTLGNLKLMIDYYISKGVKINLKNSAGKTPLANAQSSTAANSKAIADYLKSKGGSL